GRPLLTSGDCQGAGDTHPPPLWHGLLTVSPVVTEGLRENQIAGVPGDLRSNMVARSGDRATTGDGGRSGDGATTGAMSTGRMLAKAVLYAGSSFAFPDDGPWCQTLAEEWQPWKVPAFADIPRAGQVIEMGQPILTMFTHGESVDDCVGKLSEIAC